MSSISIVIPFRRLGEKEETVSGLTAVDQLNQTLSCFHNQPGVEVVVYDVSLFPIPESQLQVLPALRYVHQPQSAETPWGRVNNLAVAEASGRFLLLLNAGFLASSDFIGGLAEQVKELETKGGNAFHLYPVLSLSDPLPVGSFQHKQEAGSTTSRDVFSDLLTNCLAGRGQNTNSEVTNTSSGKINADNGITQVQGINLTTGCLLLRRHWFTALGGFRETFASAEVAQLDLMHRLAAYYPVAKKPDDYAIDVESPVPADYLGFRRYFSVYSIPHLFGKRFLVSPRQKLNPLGDDRLKEQDQAQFAEILAKGSAGCRSLNLTSIKANSELGRFMLQRPFDERASLAPQVDFLQQLMNEHGYDLKECSGLFHRSAEEQSRGVSSDGFRGKLQYLFRKPARLLKKTGLFG